MAVSGMAATSQTIDQWPRVLDESREALLTVARTGRHGAPALAHATAARMVAAWTLKPAPVDPVAHLQAEHVESRRHLVGLLDRPSRTRPAHLLRPVASAPR